ncbi:hypothetical protein EOM09_06520 [bacterium]|nr:hypothetical protein [bacterium]
MVIKTKLKKASEKPIEIFVALFIILAVAMVLLKLFRGQIADQTAEITKFQTIEAAQALCNDKCSKAKTNNCRTEDLINFCVTNYELDLDANSEIGIFSDSAYEICEDKIHCPLQINCVCGRQLSMANCVTIMDEFYTELYGGAAQSKTRIESQLKYSHGACSVVGADSWYELLVVPKLP